MTTIPEKLNTVPNDLAGFWQNRFGEKLDEFLLYTKFYNNNGSATTEVNNGVSRQVIPNIQLIKDVDVLSEYEMRTHQNTTAGKPNASDTVNAVNALNALVEFRGKGLKHLFFETPLTSINYGWVQGTPAEPNSKFAGLDIRDQAIVNKAVAAKYDTETKQQNELGEDQLKRHKLIPLDAEHINKMRQQVIETPALLESLRDVQKKLRDQFKGEQKIEKAPADLAIPAPSPSQAASPSRP